LKGMVVIVPNQGKQEMLKAEAGKSNHCTRKDCSLLGKLPASVQGCQLVSF
jgi:hypothetical protein